MDYIFYYCSPENVQNYVYMQPADTMMEHMATVG